MTVLDRHLGKDGWTDTVDLSKLFFRLTLDSATEFLFGESVNSQLGEDSASGKGNKRGDDFAQAFDRSQYTLSLGARMGNSYWMVHTPEFHRMVKKVHEFVDYFVGVAMKQTRDEKAGGGEKEKYVFLHALAQDTQDPAELRSQLLNILLAGRDTTASTLGWFFYTLADPQYNHYYTKLRTVILEEFGTYADVRTAQVDTTLPVGGGADGRSPVYVRKGQDVAYSVSLFLLSCNTSDGYRNGN